MSATTITLMPFLAAFSGSGKSAGFAVLVSAAGSAAGGPSGNAVAAGPDNLAATVSLLRSAPAVTAMELAADDAVIVGDVRGEVTFDGGEYNAYAQNSNDSAYEYFKTLAQAKKWVEKFLAI